MKYCDTTPSILKWSSEEIAIPYKSPVDNRVHRYFPDFYVKVRESSGKIVHKLIEVKPSKQTVPPKKPKDRPRDTFMKCMNMRRIWQNGKLVMNFVKIDYGHFKY